MQTGTDTCKNAPGNSRQPVDRVPGCRYRRDLAGVSVCWAARMVSIVTDADCDECEVPMILDDVDCCYLRASIASVPARNVSWLCGATDQPVNHRISPGRSCVASCERSAPRRPILE
jgi:hypothetical protein